MKIKQGMAGAAVVMLCFLTACGNEMSQEQTGSRESQMSEITSEQEPESMISDNTEPEGIEPEPSEDMETSPNKVLVAYFTRLPNTESGDDLDAVVQGGGPYGAIGESFESADMDAISSASITVTEDGTKGNVEAVAEWIAEYTVADIFSIETVEKYPLDYDTLIDQGGEEQQNRDRPELSTHIENIEQYSVIYLGYPNWYHDMPMAVYHFLEEYNLAGKTIVPFVTSAGSGLADTVRTIADMQPEAEVVETALALRMGAVASSEAEVRAWVDSLGLEP